MLLLHDNRMGFGSLTPSPYCRAPYWESPPSSAWFAPVATMSRDPYKTSVYAQSDSDASNSSTECQEGLLYSPSSPATYCRSPNSVVSTSDTPTRCMWKGCGRSFNKLDTLSSHVATEHASAHRGLFYCGWEGCLRGDKGFNARYKMLVHVRTHTKERPHSCPVCGKSFSRAENLKIHARSHSGEKPYLCTVVGCGKAYSNSSDRFKHTRTHMVEKPYCCKIPGCQKRYTDPSSLRKHVKTFKHTSTPLQTTNHGSTNTNADNSTLLQEEILPINGVDVFKLSTKKPCLSEGESVKNNEELYGRRYSSSEGDCYSVENMYHINISAQNLNINRKHIDQPGRNTQEDDEEYNKLCFCKDLPCIHTSRYVQPEYPCIQLPPLTYKNTTNSSIFLHSGLSESFVEKPLDLKRKYFEETILNIDKKTKTEYAIIKNNCTDVPLDLSNKKIV